MSSPVEPQAPVHPPARRVNAAVFVGLGLVVLGFLLALVPLLGVVGWPLMIAGLILGIIGAVKKWNPMWGNIVNIVLGFVGPGLAVILVIAGLAAAGAAKEGERAPTSTVESPGEAQTPAGEEVPAEEPAAEPDDPAEPSFVDGVLTTSDMRIEITKHKVIQPGAKGNAYGDKPVIAFWYEITNVSGNELQAYSGFLFSMKAYQDNDPNAENELDPAIMFDLESDKRHDAIKKGGTVKNVIAYTLTDERTPVDLVASDGLLGGEIGTVQYKIK